MFWGFLIVTHTMAMISSSLWSVWVVKYNPLSQRGAFDTPALGKISYLLATIHFKRSGGE